MIILILTYFSFDKQICCLNFRGDTSSGPEANDYFNITEELITLLNSDRLDFILKKDSMDSRYNRTKYFSFNLQYGDYQNNLTQTFFYNLAKTIVDRNLDLKIVILWHNSNN